MKKRLLVILVACLIAAFAWADAEGAYRILVDGKWGAISPDGRVIVEPEYDYVFPFVNGMTVVRQGGYRDGKRAYLRADGEFITGFEFDKAYHFFGPLAVVQIGGKESFVDRNGQVIERAAFDYAEDFRREYSLVRNGTWRDGQWGIVSPDGTVAIEPEYQRLSHTEDSERFVYRLEDKFGIVDPGGHRIIEPVYDNLVHSAGYLIAAQRSDGAVLMSVLDTDGSLVYKPADANEQIRYIRGGFAVINKLGKYGLVDLENGNTIEPRYDGVRVSPGPIVVTIVGSGRNRRYGLLSASGDEISPPVYVWLSGFGANGIAVISEGGKFGCINARGQMIVEPMYDQMRQFSEGYAAILQDGKWGYIDVYGNVVIEPVFDWVYDFSEGLAVVREGESDGGKRGYIDTNGNYVIEAKFDWAYSFENGVAHVAFGRHYDGTFGYIDTSGEYIWEPSN